MAKYENPQPTEGINYSDENPLKEFAQLVIGVAVAAALLIATVNVMAGTIASYIPFAFEQTMVDQFDITKREASPQQAYLQQLTDQVAAQMDLPEEIHITAHYDDSNMVNALATLGGNLIFFQGIIDVMESEQELAAVIGHEVAHIKLRHPIVALGKGVTLATLVAFVGGASGSGAGEWLVGSGANLTMLKFSRAQESRADAEAAHAIQKLYGHIGGADQLFQRFAELKSGSIANELLEKVLKDKIEKRADSSREIDLFRSHPYSGDRWQALQQLAVKNGWEVSGPLTPHEVPPVSD